VFRRFLLPDKIMAQSEDLPIYKVAVRLIDLLTDLQPHLPRMLRYHLGNRMVDLSVNMAMQVYQANMSNDKCSALTTLLLDCRELLLLLRVCFRQKGLSSGAYAEIIKQLDAIGRQATGWRLKEMKRHGTM